MIDSEGQATSPDADALVREVLERVADTWTLLVIDALDPALPTRFTRLRERIPGISQRMLTHTLRRLERDGLVARQVHPVIPPHVEYTLTPLGVSLGEALCSVWLWVERHSADVHAARRAFDTGAHASRAASRPSGGP